MFYIFYINDDIKYMFDIIGVKSIDDLFDEIFKDIIV